MANYSERMNGKSRNTLPPQATPSELTAKYKKAEYKGQVI